MCLSLFCFYQVTNVKVRLPLLEQQNNLAAVLGKYTPVVMSSFLILIGFKSRVNITVRQSRQSGVARATCPD